VADLTDRERHERLEAAGLPDEAVEWDGGELVAYMLLVQMTVGQRQVAKRAWESVTGGVLDADQYDMMVHASLTG
jgi:hypothetical protein